MKNASAILFILLFATFAACTPKEKPAEGSPEALAARGRMIYVQNCIACHNTDPSKPGSVGPEIANSSRELLEMRIIEGKYPAGYTPKRKTSQMPPLPHLKPEIPALEAYLSKK